MTGGATSRVPAAGACVVVNYASSELLRRFLAPLSVAFPGPVIVVDNASTPEERSAIDRLGAEFSWEVVALEDNLGFGAGVNRGIARAIELGADEYLILNPDAQLDAVSCSELLQRVRISPNTLLSPRIVRSDGRVWFDGALLNLETGAVASRRRAAELWPNAETAPWLSGACLAVQRGLWERLGGFDERYFLYWEDVDLSFRALREGAVLDVADDIEVTHLVGATQAANGKSDLYYLCNARNRSLFALTQLTSERRALWKRHTPAAVGEILRRGGGRRALLRRPSLILLWIRAHRMARRVDAARSAAELQPIPPRSGSASPR